MKLGNIKQKLNIFKNVTLELDKVMLFKEYIVENDYLKVVLNGKKQVKNIELKKIISPSFFNKIDFRDTFIKELNENNTKIDLDVQEEMSKLMKLK